MFLTKRKKKEITKDLSFVSVAVADTKMGAELLEQCQNRLAEIAYKIGGIKMQIDVMEYRNCLLEELELLREFKKE